MRAPKGGSTKGAASQLSDARRRGAPPLLWPKSSCTPPPKGQLVNISQKSKNTKKTLGKQRILGNLEIWRTSSQCILPFGRPDRKFDNIFLPLLVDFPFRHQAPSRFRGPPLLWPKSSCTPPMSRQLVGMPPPLGRGREQKVSRNDGLYKVFCSRPEVASKRAKKRQVL